MPTLILLCGRPFSGKSALSARLVADHGAAVVSFDAINLERGLHGGDGLPEKEWAATLESATRRTTALLAEHPLVVVDDTLCFRWLRDAFRTLGREARARVVLLYLDPPVEVLVERMRQNEVTARRHGIMPAVLAEHLRGFEPPAEDEHAITLRSVSEIEAWLAR